ncbi:MAG TPA: type II toxin-antitoxin system PrlF family antitoxin [Drouetiella sp.]
MSYQGKITTTGSSEAIRFEKELFKNNPEFKKHAKVRADIIAPGKMLVSVLDEFEASEEEDPVVGAFLAFVENDIKRNPSSVSALDSDSIARAVKLTEGVVFSDEDFQ